MPPAQGGVWCLIYHLISGPVRIPVHPVALPYPFFSREGNPMTCRSPNLQAVVLWAAVLSANQCLSFWCHVHSSLDTTGRGGTCTSELSMLNLSMAMNIWGTVAVWLSRPSLTGKEIAFWVINAGIFFWMNKPYWGLNQGSDHAGVTA